MDRKGVFEMLFKGVVITGLVILIILQVVQPEKIVYVDAVRLMNGYKGMQAARKEYEARTQTFRANLDTLKLELEGKIKEYEKTASKLSAKEKSLMEELINNKEEQYLNYENIISEKLKKEDQDLTGQVLSKVNDYIKKYGEKNGYEIILAATQYGNIVYAKDGKDITEEVLNGLNNEIGK